MSYFEAQHNTECQQCYAMRSNNGYETYDAPALSMAVEKEDMTTTEAATTNTIDPNEIDQILSRELNNLDVRDRESISEEVHGVRCVALPETAEMLTESLSRLSEELDAIYVKPAFDRSQKLGHDASGTYVNTKDFRLRFLRCELFDAKKAAIRLVSFLDFLMDIFEGNEELLLRPMRLLDFTPHELAILKAGNFQLLPYRDRSGRRILTVILNITLAFDFRISSKFLLYFFYVASESVESQRKGIVKIFYPFTSIFKTLPGLEDRKIAARLNDAVPIRTVAMHFCVPDTLHFRMFRAIVITSAPEARFRFKTHFGT